MSERQKQVGHVESDARAANEVISVDGEEANLAGSALLAVLCECGDAKCNEPLTMTVDEYEDIRAHPSHFAVLVGHEMLDCERISMAHEGYLVVEKFGDAGDVADASDPRFSLKPCRVVIVDDTPEIIYLLRIVLSMEPSCTVVGDAEDGAEALTVVERLQPEVIVLDLEMPVMDGWHALPLLRRMAPTSHIIVFSSAHLDARQHKRLVNLGSDRFIPKGGDPSVLASAIREVATSGRDRQFAPGEQT
ncbi:MAG: hypothetical protein JWM86_1086 [Thermoleophilia bacterium]|nr:hypothetical protein [Thermoleophilia bacterium]